VSTYILVMVTGPSVLSTKILLTDALFTLIVMAIAKALFIRNSFDYALTFLEIAFVVKTQNKWGMAVKKGNQALVSEVNEALAILKSTGRLKVTWEKWMPSLAYPFS